MDDNKQPIDIVTGLILLSPVLLGLTLPSAAAFSIVMTLFTGGVVFSLLKWAKHVSKAGKAANIILCVMVVFCATLSVEQAQSVYNKYRLFMDEYNQQLWVNRMGEAAFALSYMLTLFLIALTVIAFVIRWHFRKYLLTSLRIIVCISLVVSLFASGWLCQMHSKKRIVGYNEWIRHGKSLSAQIEKPEPNQ